MVRRYDILKGDLTTKHGVVLGGSAVDSIDGRDQAYEGDPVRCPECKSVGRIVCVGPRLPSKGADGRESALSEDLCVCKCDPSPRIIASQISSFVEI